MSFQVSNSPFDEQQVELLNRLLPTLAPEQTVWLSGYLAGLAGITPGQAESAVPAVAEARQAAAAPRVSEVTVLYGSQTGNAASLAAEVSRRLDQSGFPVHLACMSDFKVRNLKKVERLLVVVSTHGEGDPPDNAVQFCEFLYGKRAPQVEGLKFSVLALGDVTYDHFCKTGRDIDERLAELGGVRLADRADCDVDYDEPAEAWMQGVLAALEAESAAAAPSAVPSKASAQAGEGEEPRYGRTRPFLAEVLDNVCLNGRGSDKETRHLELLIEGSGLAFEPGDSLGMIPQNCPKLTEQLIREMRWNREDMVSIGKEEVPLHDALHRYCEITVLTKPLLQQAAQFSRDGLRDLVRPEKSDELRAYLDGRDLLDLVRDYALVGTPAREFVAILRKLPPRLYSLASSYRANPEEAHVTVAAVRYEAHNRTRHGVCSVQCAERLKPGDQLPVYVNSNPNFRMPADSGAAMIMIGPGTGVAPFRAFLEDREEIGADGKNWLFFGDRRFRTDFLYQTDWQRWIKEGLLTRMHVAFSRDSDHKVYVQHRMLENSRELFEWIEDGAYVYVCGDEKQMASDVHTALETIVESEGGMSSEQARRYVADMMQQNRYQRDVY